MRTHTSLPHPSLPPPDTHARTDASTRADKKQYTALMHAASQGGHEQAEQVQLMVDAGCDFELKGTCGACGAWARGAHQHAN